MTTQEYVAWRGFQDGRCNAKLQRKYNKVIIQPIEAELRKRAEAEHGSELAAVYAQEFCKGFSKVNKNPRKRDGKPLIEIL